jgi:hypothetical protein
MHLHSRLLYCSRTMISFCKALVDLLRHSHARWHHPSLYLLRNCLDKNFMERSTTMSRVWSSRAQRSAQQPPKTILLM